MLIITRPFSPVSINSTDVVVADFDILWRIVRATVNEVEHVRTLVPSMAISSPELRIKMRDRVCSGSSTEHQLHASEKQTSFDTL